MKIYLYKNKNKVTNPKAPDYVLNIKLDKPDQGKDGKMYNFRKVGALWLQDNPKTGEKYMSGELETEKLQQETPHLLSQEEMEAIKAIKKAEQDKKDKFESKKVADENDFGF